VGWLAIRKIITNSPLPRFGPLIEDVLNLPSPHCPTNEYGNGSQVDQSVARKAQQEPEGEMEETETAAAAEALGYRSRPAIY